MTNDALRDILHNAGVELYDTETVTENERKIYRVYITCKGGVTLDQCGEVTKIISPLFDLEPPVAGQYYLEVSSPGIERRLSTRQHYEASVGDLLKIWLFSTERVKGELLRVDEKGILIKETDGEETTIAFDDIEKCRTYFEW